MKKKFLNLLQQPITNSYLINTKSSTLKKEFFYNLSMIIDLDNYLVSIKKPVNPKNQYTDMYAHRASESKTMNLSFKKIAETLKKKYRPKLSLEIGSNDGVFLKNFHKKKLLLLNHVKISPKLQIKKGILLMIDFGMLI